MTLTLSRVWWINSHPKVEVLSEMGCQEIRSLTDPTGFLDLFLFFSYRDFVFMGIFLKLQQKWGIFFVPKGGISAKKVVVVFGSKKIPTNFGVCFLGPPLDGKVPGGYLNTVVKSKLRSMAKKSVKSEAGLGGGGVA